MSEIYRTLNIPPNPNENPPNPGISPISTSDSIFQINSAKFYVPVVTLSINAKFLGTNIDLK